VQFNVLLPQLNNYSSHRHWYVGDTLRGEVARDKDWYDKACRELKKTTNYSLSSAKKGKWKKEKREKYLNDRALYDKSKKIMFSLFITESKDEIRLNPPPPRPPVTPDYGSTHLNSRQT